MRPPASCSSRWARAGEAEKTLSFPASHTQLSGTNVQVTREPTFPSGINVSKRPELLLLPFTQYDFRPLELN